MMRHFCTYCDHRYLPRALAMFESLRLFSPGAILWVLCLNDECFDLIESLEFDGLQAIPLVTLETHDSGLLATKQTRSRVEYYFTCSPCLPLFLLETCPEIELITYLDSDLYFFSSPEPVFEEMGARSVAIIEHRFPEAHGWMLKNGRFNVGWLSFRRSEDGMACLRWWRERCIEWCYDRIEEGRFADQKYLDQFPARFPNTAIILHRGSNLAAWNLANYKLSRRAGLVLVDDLPVIFFHFQGVRRLSAWIVDPNVQWYSIRLSLSMELFLYRPYLNHLSRAYRRLNTTKSGTDLSALPRAHDLANHNEVKAGWILDAKNGFVTFARRVRAVISRRFILHRLC